MAPAARTLSFAITTRGPARRVRALLERVRPHVDEVVLAVDAKGDPEVLEACADLADRRTTFDLRESPARLVGWIQSLCSCDWILRLDDDELPGHALLEALPELLADRRPSQYSLRRHWLWPRPTQRIASAPWNVDYQARLLRNAPGAWTFEGSVHTVGEVRGETRYIDLPIYHLDLLTSSPDQRRLKAAQYEAEVPGIVFDGLSVNGPYLPELGGDLQLASIDPEDAEAARALVDGSPETAPPGAGSPIEHATFADIDRHNRRRRPTDDAFQADVRPEPWDRRMTAGVVRQLVVRVRNTGEDPFPRVPAWYEPVQLTYAWRHLEGRQGHRGYTRFPETIWPGQEGRVLIGVRAPGKPGEWRLELGLERADRRLGEWAGEDVVVAAAQPFEVPADLEAVAGLGTLSREIDAERQRLHAARAAAREMAATRRFRLGSRLTGRGSTNGHLSSNGHRELRPANPRPVPKVRATPRLSFAMTTRGPSDRARALLEIMRPHVDEVVLAVDQDAAQDVHADCADLADRRLTFPSPGMGSLLIPWILHECSGDWIVRLDDDEAPSPALLEALPELMEDRVPLRYGFVRRWLWPGPESWISAAPWGVEHQYRLVRNIPGLWRFNGRVHSAEEVMGDTRYLDLPIYHLDPLIQALERRRAKALAYELMRGGVRYSGISVNTLYLPEAFGELEVSPVPAQDRAHVEALLAPPPVPQAAERADDLRIEHVDSQRLQAHSPLRTLSPRAHRGAVRLHEVPEIVPPNTIRVAVAVVSNHGDEIWPWGEESDPLIRVCYRWRRLSDGAVLLDGRALFPESVYPGSDVRMIVGVKTPDAAGEYRLEVGLMHEHVCTFGHEAGTNVVVDPFAGAQDLVAALPPEYLAAEIRATREALLGQRGLAGAERELVEAELEALRESGAYRVGEALGGLFDRARGGTGAGADT